MRRSISPGPKRARALEHHVLEEVGDAAVARAARRACRRGRRGREVTTAPGGSPAGRRSGRCPAAPGGAGRGATSGSAALRGCELVSLIILLPAKGRPRSSRAPCPPSPETSTRTSCRRWPGAMIEIRCLPGDSLSNSRGRRRPPEYSPGLAHRLAVHQHGGARAARTRKETPSRTRRVWRSEASTSSAASGCRRADDGRHCRSRPPRRRSAAPSCPACGS